MKRPIAILILLWAGLLASAQDTTAFNISALIDSLNEVGVGQWGQENVSHRPATDTVYLYRTDTLTVYHTDSVP